ncbi:O-antigen ligase [Saccharothrix tamanrassetensis]|uniref:O-antigen ligase n=1 Tax=Saccharothrix tamanrassetensis TaxID=1051531 RepID=A0A841C9X5_9PSEU|nr:hypothetical protein [Saccharothrix tamanrassetensis]MBB5954209.1 O-antigen ligase [Saccharothrix tamanrassetensis]
MAGLARLSDEMVGVAVVLLVFARNGSAALSGAVGGALVVRLHPSVVILLVAVAQWVAATLGVIAARPSKAVRVTP